MSREATAAESHHLQSLDLGNSFVILYLLAAFDELNGTNFSCGLISAELHEAECATVKFLDLQARTINITNVMYVVAGEKSARHGARAHLLIFWVSCQRLRLAPATHGRRGKSHEE